jgi:hypothetical protein
MSGDDPMRSRLMEWDIWTDQTKFLHNLMLTLADGEKYAKASPPGNGRREAFLEARRLERQKAEAGVVDEWELCETCGDERRERGSWWCKRCFEEMRQYAD